jgi:hypothetical protein
VFFCSYFGPSFGSFGFSLGEKPVPGRSSLPRVDSKRPSSSVPFFSLNAGYGFEGTFEALGDYRFSSNLLGGAEKERTEARSREGNRFSACCLGKVPVALPRNYVRGADLQWQELENHGRYKVSYLRGEIRNHGWYYYYVYALLVKVPLGTWILAALAVVLTLIQREAGAGWRNEVFLLTPILAILLLVSSQTGFNHHLRYMLPIFPFAFVWISRVAQPEFLLWKCLLIVALLWTVGSSLWVYPHSLSYFNELAGGPSRGAEHLLDTNIDWGQDLLFLKGWLNEHPGAAPLPVATWVPYNIRQIHPGFKNMPAKPEEGWFAVSVNHLHGYLPGGGKDSRLVYFQEFKAIDRVGYSLYIYHLNEEQAAKARRLVRDRHVE